jgi:hypothetical protein
MEGDDVERGIKFGQERFGRASEGRGEDKRTAKNIKTETKFKHSTIDGNIKDKEVDDERSQTKTAKHRWVNWLPFARTEAWSEGLVLANE